MTTQTYEERPGIWNLVKVLVALVALVLVVSWLLNRYVSGEAAPVVQAEPAETIKIATGNAEYPMLTLTVERNAESWLITDEDGDRFRCEVKPATIRDLDACTFAG